MSAAPGDERRTYVNDAVQELLARDAPASILDFGCGYGRALLPLLRAGFDARGVDPDLGALARASEALVAEGFDRERVQPIVDGRTPFDDESFDFVYSEQVIEHVADLATFTDEIWRVSAPGATGIHNFPARRGVVESHVRVPFVHWLPKRRVRYWFLRLAFRAGLRPPWPPELPAGAGDAALAEFSYAYLNDRTFYRSYSEVADAFAACGFDVRPIPHPGTRHFGPIAPVVAPVVRLFLNVTLHTVKQTGDGTGAA